MDDFIVDMDEDRFEDGEPAELFWAVVIQKVKGKLRILLIFMKS
jgi:hypothetical protein